MTGGGPSALPDAALFDIDGTLLVGSSAHLAVLAEVLSKRVGGHVAIDLDGERPLLDGRDIAGWIDVQVVRFVLAGRLGQVDEPDVQAIMHTYGDAYRLLLRTSARAGTPVGGAGAALARLQAAGVSLGLVTGNCSVVAKAKLDAVGLAGFFDFDRDLGFGDWRRDRAAIARSAVVAVSRGQPAHHEIVIVGDTAGDMRAAALAGARGVGVTTGAASEQALLEAGATTVLPSVAAIWPAAEGAAHAE